jgi:hypothetical protein
MSAGSATKAGGGKGGGGGLKSLAAGLTAMGTPQVAFGALNLILATPGLVLMIAAIPFLTFMMIPVGEIWQANFEGLGAGLSAMGNPKGFLGALLLIVAAPGLALMMMAIPFLAFMAIPAIGVMIKMGLMGLGSGLQSLGSAAANPYVWLAVLLLAALGGVFVIFAYGIKLVAEGLAIVVASFTQMFAVVNADNIGPLLLLGPALMLLSLGLLTLIPTLMGFGLAWLFGGWAVKDMTLSLGALAGVDLSGLGTSVQAINDVDMGKVEALRDLAQSLSMVSVMSGGGFKVEIGDLDVKGNIKLEGNGGGGTAEMVMTEPYLSQLKDLIWKAMEDGRNGYGS